MFSYVSTKRCIFDGDFPLFSVEPSNQPSDGVQLRGNRWRGAMLRSRRRNKKSINLGPWWRVGLMLGFQATLLARKDGDTQIIWGIDIWHANTPGARKMMKRWWYSDDFWGIDSIGHLTFDMPIVKTELDVMVKRNSFGSTMSGWISSEAHHFQIVVSFSYYQVCELLWFSQIQ